MASFSPPRRTGYAPQVDAQGNQVSEVLPNEFSSLAGTRQQLEQQLVAAHRTKNVQAAQQAAYAIRAYDSAITRGYSGFDYSVPQPTLDVSDLVAPSGSAGTDESQWGKREDGTNKGQGFLGLLRRPDGGVSSEISIGVNMDGKEISLPLMVPTLTRQETETLLALPQDENFNRNLPASIKNKAISYARQRISQGKSTFASPEESQSLRFDTSTVQHIPKPTFGSWLGNVTAGIGEGLGEQVQGLGGMIERGVTAFAQDPLKASAAAFMTALEPARQGFTQPVQAAKDIGTGIVETGKQMYQQATSGPIGLGQTIGQMIDLPGPSLPGGKRRPTMAELDVYHGTPHTFDPETGAPLGRFRSEKIGTGEGKQAYGYGLYLAENPRVAKQYQESLTNLYGTPTTITGGGSSVTVPLWMADKVKKDGIDSVINEWTNRVAEQRAAIKTSLQPWQHESNLQSFESDLETLKQIKNSGEAKVLDAGRLYKVDLPDAKIEQMLDWDKPLSQQPKSILNVAQSVANDVPNGIVAEILREEGIKGFASGGDLYRSISQDLGSDSYASQALLSKGQIPGIKYLDAGSRAGEKGTRNFVVFPGEEQSLNILERDGVKAEVPKPVAPVIDTTKPKREQLRQLHQQSGVSFVDATIDRGGAHTPAGPTSGSPAYDVALNGTYPEDFYGANGLRYYGTGYDAMDRQAYDKLRRLEGNPNSAVEVYRAVEKDGPKTISPGDWVTTVRDYAKDHGESALNGDYKIVKMLVNARDIYTAGDSMLEWGYHPQPRMPQLPKATK